MFCATKPSWRTAVEDIKSWRHGRKSRDWRRNGRRRHLGPRGGEEVTGVRRRIGPPEGRGGNGVQGHGVEAGIFPRVEFWRFSQNRPPTRVSRTLQNRGPDRGEDFVSKKEPRPSDEIVYRGCCRPTGLTGPAYRSDRSRGYKYPSTCVRLLRILELVRELSISPGRRPCVSLPPFFPLG